MTIIYRETDAVSGRWTGNSGGIDLSAAQIDGNFYQLASDIATLGAALGFTVSISYITISGNQITFHMTDHTTQGPFTVPVATFSDRGVWTPLTAYAVNDTFNIDGTLYLVIFAHTSQATFSAGANDGLGHNYYSALLSVPGDVLPTGGAVNMFLAKSDGHDFDVMWKYPVPVGGSTGQVLTKVNGTDFNMEWSSVATSMESLSDFSFASPHSVGQVVQWTGSAWQNQTLSVTFADISDIILSSPHSIGDVLTWDGSHWTNQPSGGGGSVETLSDVSFTVGGAPSAGALFFFNGTTWDGNDTPPTCGGVFWDGSNWKPTTSAALGTSGSISINLANGANVLMLTPTGDVTLSVPSAPNLAEFTLIVHTSGTTSRTITFDGGTFRAQGNLVTGTVDDKYFTLKFIVHPTIGWVIEVSRTVAT